MDGFWFDHKTGGTIMGDVSTGKVKMRSKPKQVRGNTPADIFTHAALLLLERGWCQLTMGITSTGPMCVMGAVGCARHNNVLSGYNSPTEEGQLKALLGGRDIFMWNDAEGRTKEEVLELLFKAAEQADKDARRSKRRR